MSYLLDPPGLDEEIAELWQDIRDAAVAALPDWARDMYGYPAPAAADRPPAGRRSARPSACSTRCSSPSPACSRPGSGSPCGCAGQFVGRGLEGAGPRTLAALGRGGGASIAALAVLGRRRGRDLAGGSV